MPTQDLWMLESMAIELERDAEEARQWAIAEVRDLPKAVYHAIMDGVRAQQERAMQYRRLIQACSGGSDA